MYVHIHVGNVLTYTLYLPPTLSNRSFRICLTYLYMLNVSFSTYIQPLPGQVTTILEIVSTIVFLYRVSLCKNKPPNNVLLSVLVRGTVQYPLF